MSLLKIENEANFTSAMSTGVNLFLGAGFSTLATNKDGDPLPIGDSLRQALLDKFSLTLPGDTPLSRISTILSRTRKEEFNAFLKEKYSVTEFDDRYLNLGNANLRTIFTTNIDDLIIQVFRNSKIHYINDLDLRGPTLSQKEAIETVWLHGCVYNATRPFVFGTTDIASAFRQDEDRWYLLTNRLQKYPTVFVGYRLDDSSTLEALSPQTISGRPHQDKWILLREPVEDGAIEYFRALDFQIIYGDTSGFLDFLDELRVPEKVEAYHDSSELFPNDTIPQIGSTPVRSLLDFYLGAPPVWSDIFSGELHKISYESAIRNDILLRRNVIIIGVPASGKTTLMMQVASEILFSGYKIVLDSITTERAQLIINKLNGASCLIFVDQFCDDINGFIRLAGESNIRLVGFDREYNFELISHRLQRNKFTIVDVTEISKRDIQELLEKIPERIYSHPTVNLKSNDISSLFEFMDTYIRGRKLRDRYLNVIKQLAIADSRLSELLLVSCYVHSCRTPVSMDMLIAYFGDSVDDYTEIYNLRKALGALLNEPIEAWQDENQDYYVPRSVAVSESVMEKSPVNQLRKVIRQFHDRVTPYRIARYDVFKRNGYDHKIMDKIFYDWQEGYDFYDKIYLRDSDPYFLQHGALYLAKRKRYSEAFRWIDRALVQTKNRNFSIRNSHAQILFQANIDKNPDDPVVLPTLLDSMKILSECYGSDRRKAYHASVYGAQAMRLGEVYGMDIAKTHLVNAKKWLTEEKVRSPWNRDVKRLHKDIDKILI